MPNSPSGGIAIGDVAPDFELPDTEGRRHSLSQRADAPARVVIFTCNHCPYALAWHDRLMAVGRDYAERGVRFFAVNPNDAERYPADSLEAMQARVREEDWPMPYLRDESQDVARAFGARTPMTTSPEHPRPHVRVGVFSNGKHHAVLHQRPGLPDCRLRILERGRRTLDLSGRHVFREVGHPHKDRASAHARLGLHDARGQSPSTTLGRGC